MKRIVILIYFFTTSMFGQMTDLARLEYSYFPQKESENSFKRIRAYVNYPIKLSDKENYIVVGLEYRNVSFKFNDDVNFDNSDLDNLNSYEFSLGYTFKINDELRFAASSGVLVASNFENKDIENNDVLYSGEVYLIKDKTKDPNISKPWRLIAGLGYSTTTGFPFPLPIINYYRKFRPDWTFAVGVPNSNIKYYLTKKNVFQAFATLDGFYANIQRKRQIPIENSTNTNTASNISMRVALGGLGYEYYITKHLVFYTYAGHTFINSIRLRNDDRDDVYKINEKNSFYFRGGIKFNI